MKIIFTLCLAVSFVMIGALVAAAQSKTESKVLRHVVLFKFKDSATPEDVNKVEVAFADLPGKLPLIKGYEWGKNNSPENLNQGLTHCFLLTFSNEKDRDAYLIHPDHKAFGKILGPYLDKVTVVDYWTEK
jgi:Stress responsive A/B Barrel Domain